MSEVWLTLIGIGEEGVAGLSAAARTLVSQAAYVVGGARHLALAGELIQGETLVWPSPFQNGIDAVLARVAHRLWCWPRAIRFLRRWRNACPACAAGRNVVSACSILRFSGLCAAGLGLAGLPGDFPLRALPAADAAIFAARRTSAGAVRG